MKINKIITLLGLAAFAAGSASAQLIYTNEGITSPPSTIRANAPDVAALLGGDATAAGFTLGSLPGLTFNNITGTLAPNEFTVGFNGSFTQFAEVSYLAKSSQDSNNFVSFGLATGNTTLFANYSATTTNTWRIDGTGSSVLPANTIDFKHFDTTFGTNGDQFNTSIFHWDLSTDDPNYNYYVAFVDDRASDAATRDFNDGIFLVRVNTLQIGFIPVPEPSTYAMTGGLALLALIAVRKYRKTVFQV
jgi:hypothetical protein